MTLRFRPFVTAALLALGVASTPAQAQEQDQGWFIGAGGGVSKLEDGCAILGGSGSSCDDNGTYWKVFGGYRFNSYFGYELAYANFGELKISTAGSTTTYEATGMEISLFARLPISRDFSVYAKYGLYRWDVDLNVSGTGAFTASADGNDTTYGFGADYNFTKNIAARLEYQKYFDAGDAVTGTVDISAGLIGIVIKF
ncbi:MAG TPA: outer membrane beta-barrel protein [Burkholderiales bacterium]|nr:outer membrane beta-barrel protein [Burkholderiales bacterium]